ncbi:hypothetical protein CRV24_000064 [Beauveria bassiana]|nr:hypothetical protein CRV24_000064 [Beauveria bassiana]KAH8721423.1 hypothetical protein HC256_001779 [Beauveria bassiana]
MPSTSSSSVSSSTVAATFDDKAVVKWVETVAKKEAKCSSIIMMVARDDDTRQSTKDYLKTALDKKSYSGLLVTTPVELQTTINKIKRKGKLGALILLFGAGILGAKFDVPGIFPELQVHRGASTSAEQRLVIEGSSKYHEVRLDKWEAHRHKNHVLKLGFQKGVVIGLEGLTALSNPDWCKARNNLDEAERADLDKNFEQVRRHKNDWETVKPYVAAIYGLLVATTKFVAGISATAGGFYAKYAFGHHAAEIGMAGAKVTVIATAAGPAVRPRSILYPAPMYCPG